MKKEEFMNWYTESDDADYIFSASIIKEGDKDSISIHKIYRKDIRAIIYRCKNDNHSIELAKDINEKKLLIIYVLISDLYLENDEIIVNNIDKKGGN
jgi:hypothetical protein